MKISKELLLRGLLLIIQLLLEGSKKLLGARSATDYQKFSAVNQRYLEKQGSLDLDESKK